MRGLNLDDSILPDSLIPLPHFTLFCLLLLERWFKHGGHACLAHNIIHRLNLYTRFHFLKENVTENILSCATSPGATVFIR